MLRHTSRLILIHLQKFDGEKMENILQLQQKKTTHQNSESGKEHAFYHQQVKLQHNKSINLLGDQWET